MRQAIAALLGAVTGFFLPLLATYFRTRIKGTRFENAVEMEIDEAKDNVHEKMLWLSRDNELFKDKINDRLLVPYRGALLYLGEREDFSIVLPFWDNNLRDVIEVTSTSGFNRMCREISLLRRFVAKFREMKMAFEVEGGDTKAMALACYNDLLSIDGVLQSGRA
jgi:hypothetical protein